MPLTPVSGPFPSAGPYYIAAATPGRSLVLLRNPNYHGDRPRRPRRIDVVIGPQHPVEAVEASRLDYAIDGVPCRPERAASNVSTAPAAPPRVAASSSTSSFPCSEVDMIRPEHESAALRDRAHAARGQLRRRPASAGGERRHLLRACDGRADVPPARRARASATSTSIRSDPMSPTARRLAGPGRHTALLYC